MHELHMPTDRKTDKGQAWYGKDAQFFGRPFCCPRKERLVVQTVEEEEEQAEEEGEAV